MARQSIFLTRRVEYDTHCKLFRIYIYSAVCVWLDGDVMNNDAYEWYDAAMQGNIVLHDDTPPQAGFYKIRAVPYTTYIKPQYKQFEPVCFEWEGDKDEEGFLIDDEFLICYVRDYKMTNEQGLSIWQECCDNPISQQEYFELLEE